VILNKFKLKENFFSRNRYILIILIIAFILRIWGFNFGLPYIYNPDEPGYTGKAINFFTGDFNPHWFGHPGASLINILFFLYSIYFFIGLILGNFSNISSFIDFFDSNPSLFYLLGRFATGVFGVISVYILYCLVKKIFDQEYALISAIIFAVAPIHVLHSKIIRTDITQTMLILSALYFLVKYIELNKLNILIFASIFFGLSVATKWPSVILIISFLITFIITQKKLILNNSKRKLNLLSYIIIIILASILCISFFVYINKDNIFFPFITKLFINKELRHGGLNKLLFISEIFLISFITISTFSLISFLLSSFQIRFFQIISSAIINVLSNKKSLFSLLTVFISFFITAPFVFLDFTEAIKWIIIEGRSAHIGATGKGIFDNLLFYLKGPFNVDFGGILIECFLFIGIVLLIKNWKKLNTNHLVIFSFPLLYFLAIIKLPLHWDRWVIPILPFMAILSAIGLKDFLTLFNINRSYRNSILLFILIVLLISPLKNSILNNYKLSQKDTRTISKEWIESHLPKNSIIAYEHYAPHLHIRKREDFVLHNMDWNKIIIMPLSYYIKNNIDFIIITDAFKKKYYKKPEAYKNIIRRYEILEAKCERIKTFKPEKYQPGPEIIIYKVPKK
jgi:4-amino-4-deoxy-L-arabinose transferase-like glycosyltransferase